VLHVPPLILLDLIILAYLNPLNSMLYSKVEKQCRLSVSLFQTISNRKHVRQVFAYPGSAVCFIQTHFYYPYPFHWDTKLKDMIAQDLPPNWLICFLESYE
jgi:hypothetical protein